MNTIFLISAADDMCMHHQQGIDTGLLVGNMQLHMLFIRIQMTVDQVQ